MFRKYQEKLSIVELSRKGGCIDKLKLVSIGLGLFNLTTLTFENCLKDKPLLSNKITIGDIVAVRRSNDKTTLASGVVYSMNTFNICVALDKGSLFNETQNFGNFVLIKLTNDVTYRRLKNALNSLREGNKLSSILFGEQRISRPVSIESVPFINPFLDDSQKEAVRFALSAKEIAIIHGPPGTGKTTTIVEIILQLAKNYKLLICAPSNVAVDNLLEKLASFKTRKLIRLGHPARASSNLHSYTLDSALFHSDQACLIKDIRNEIEAARKNFSQKREIKNLLKDLKKREKSVVHDILRDSNIILSTLTTASPDGPLKHLYLKDKPNFFDVVIIDECSQALELACWIALPAASKCILAGDHFQLPPTIISEEAAKAGLEVTLMERLLQIESSEKLMKMLTVQYRMHQDIMQWSSQSFYQNKLTAHESVREKTLLEISSLDDCSPVLLIDTAGCDMEELDLEDEESKGNEYEADIVAIYVSYLIENGVKPWHIGIITPYNLQVELLKLRLNDKYPKVEIKSVDGFQGREKEVIILTLVRSNQAGDVGFLSDFRRINVATTRAKKHLVIVGDSETISNDKHLDSLVKYIFENGQVKSAQEYESLMGQYQNIERPSHLRFKLNSNINSKEQFKLNLKKQVETKEQHEQAKEDEKRKKKIKSKIIDFVNNDAKELNFSSKLNSFERRIVHELAEKYKLKHQSQDEGKKRFITISK